MTQNRTMESIEAWLSAFTGTLLSFFFLLVVVLPNQWALRIPLPLFLLLLFTMVYFLEGRFLIQLWVCTFCGRIPIGPAVANAFGNGHAVVRIAEAFWWLAHTLAGLFFVIGMEARLLVEMKQPQGLKIAMAVMLFGCTICCNIFIALVIKTISGRDSAVQAFWKWRLTVDAAVSALAVLASEWLL
jgi:archaellum biogenesis protein FlaJ (TadC family)